MRIVVLGAGLTGVTSAWFLAADGHELTVIDRQPGPALETSFANGGQISTSHAEPWANPAAPLKVLKWLGREDAPLLWRFSADPAQWAWGLRFLRECCPERTRANIRAILALALDSRTRLKALRHELALEYSCLERGILHFYTDPAEFARALPQAALMREFGCERVVKSAAECLGIEPALAHAAAPIVGGTFTADDESGDAQLFTAALADHCTARGVQFRYNTTLAGLETAGGQVAAVRLANGDRLTADAYVVALGSYSTLLMRQVGIGIPVYPAKGYSISVPLQAGALASEVSLIDDEVKMVYSRLGDRLRVAGTAEFSGYDTSLNATRIDALVRRTRQMFPQLEFSAAAIEPWAGLRPSTPSNVPIIGPTALQNLYLNTGHGTLGWTMAVGSGRLLADQLAGRVPEIDPRPYLPSK
ncbi:MAG: D-amino acid dehydrogenase [Gammaproteobacteria bacterium]|nr:D-amino acid dehydrogenase [Rhodocyclaceae bacterium]MBU3910808.1 D-amino acid dehydrogenase [Gammaproteobacteria bacterium]MBU3988449.1 D-amino acid dehydrogenase [Gammaproteobacteria bacterium]MBU4006262.1 D-amino acid dehydrogenase [Gammaproteobacteria bacterium]MBU4097869.1 D-amino acid dehydrogenase [Gammaproteobacteria bacterium]